VAVVTENGTAKLAGRREWIALAVLCLPTMLVMLDLNVVILALPHISTALHASVTQGLWLTDIYGFLIAGFLVTMGRIGDRVGYRNLLLVGSLAFGVLSIFAAYSSSAGEMIAIRALLGIAGATIMPSILALIRNMFPDPKQMGGAMGIWSMAMVVGISLGPTLGGLLLNSFWWGSIFLIAVPVMVLLLATGPFLLPNIKSDSPGKLDFLSVGLSLATILPIIYGLKELARNGWAWSSFIVLVAGIVIGVIFVTRQRRLAYPLLDLRLFAVRAVSGALVLNLLAGTVLGGNGLLMTLHLQLVEGYSPLVAALWLLLPSVIVIFGIQVAMQLTKKIKPNAVLAGGTLVGAAGMVVLTQVNAVGGMVVLMIGVCIVFAGVAPVNMLSNQLVMLSAPPEKAGSAGSLGTTSGELGTAFGIAAIGSLATVFYQAHLTVPAGVPAGAASAANDSLASATSAASSLGGSAGQDLLSAAREAFTLAYNNVAIVLAVLFVVLAVIAYTTLKQIPAFGAPPAPPADAETETAVSTSDASGEGDDASETVRT
jgi:DHA2 family multidrug resistance protein-like MFS transporter